MRKKPPIDYLLNDKFEIETTSIAKAPFPSTPMDADNKITVSGGRVTLPYKTEWQFVPMDTLQQIANTAVKPDKRYKNGYRIVNLSALFIMSDYFMSVCQAAHMPNGSLDGTHILLDSPTIWRFTWTPEGGEPRHLEIEHDDLTPEKLAEVCK